MRDQLTQACPVCGSDVELDRRTSLCQACWEVLAFDHLDLARNVVRTWERRSAAPKQYKAAVDAAVAAVRADVLPVVDLPVLDAEASDAVLA